MIEYISTGVHTWSRSLEHDSSKHSTGDVLTLEELQHQNMFLKICLFFIKIATNVADCVHTADGKGLKLVSQLIVCKKTHQHLANKHAHSHYQCQIVYSHGWEGPRYAELWVSLKAVDVSETTSMAGSPKRS